MEHINGASLTAAALLLTAVCGALAAVWKGVEAYRNLTGSERRRAERAGLRQAMESLEGRVSACEERLRRGDARFEGVHGDMTQMLTVLNAMLMHFISGNDHDKLRGVKEQLDRYLTGR